MEQHDYRETIREATEIEDEREAKLETAEDNAIMYEALMINGSMGMLGMNETNANLIQLEVAQELLYDLNHDDAISHHEYKPFD
ncbi:MAG: hypothetical protein HDT28_02330 [Clostridiales bacterium]|nr:hypothetical protein [Clostridiales bacterium]